MDAKTAELAKTKYSRLVIFGSFKDLGLEAANLR